MKKKWLRVMLFMLTAIAVIPMTSEVCAQPGSDFAQLADRVVKDCAGIKEGDIVLVTGGVRDAKLLEDIAIHCRKLGAFALISLSSAQMDRRYYDEVSPKFDSQLSRLGLMLADNVSAVISVDYYESSDVMLGVPNERINAVAKAGIPVADAYLKRNVRQLSLGNNMYPTTSLASNFGVTKEQLSALFWDGINVDYAMLQETASKVKAILSGGKEVRITNPNGTDLKFAIQGKPVLASDGVIGPDDIKQGGASCMVFLPAGEVYLVPVVGSAEGKVVVDRQLYQGKDIAGLTMTFRQGKMVSMTARSGLEPYQAIYDASSGDKSELAYLDLGINPKVMLPAGSKVDAWMAAGMVTIGLGNNYWAGGENRSTFSSAHFLRGSTLKVDDRILVDAGVLKL
jgi:leucyl aminopeptidase (aminopeptidase T)